MLSQLPCRSVNSGMVLAPAANNCATISAVNERDAASFPGKSPAMLGPASRTHKQAADPYSEPGMHVDYRRLAMTFGVAEKMGLARCTRVSGRSARNSIQQAGTSAARSRNERWSGPCAQYRLPDALSWPAPSRTCLTIFPADVDKRAASDSRVANW